MGADSKGRRHKTSGDWVQQMMPQVRCWLPGYRLVLVVDGGVAALSLALAWAKRQVVMVSRLRSDAVLYHPPGPQSPGKRVPKPLKQLVRRHLWRAQYVVNSVAEPGFMLFAREAFKRLLTGFPSVG